jgi:uncharacterized protein YktB (UPF0637 family)
MSVQQLWGAVIVIIAGYILGFYFQHRDHAALRSEMNVRLAGLDKRIDDLRSEVNLQLAALDKRIDDLRSEVNLQLAALDKRIDDLRSEVNARFEDFKELLHSELQRIEGQVHTGGRN